MDMYYIYKDLLKLILRFNKSRHFYLSICFCTYITNFQGSTTYCLQMFTRLQKIDVEIDNHIKQIET